VADMIGRVGKVVEAYEFVKGLGEDGNTMEIRGSLLGAYKNLRIELWKVVARKLLNMGSEKRMGYHILLSNIYAEEESENVLQNEVGCSWVEISGFVNCFVSRDEKHPQSHEIYYEWIE
jgi:hypothetical protein